MSNETNQNQTDGGQSYSIGELADAAGVTVRTIRYYTAEGLLPAPETQGKYARYNQSHLQRLQLIARLKGAYLPLHEIRARIETLDPAGVQALLDEPAPQPVAETSSAADYIAAVMAQQLPQRSTTESAPMQMAAPAAPAPPPAAALASASPRPGFFRKLVSGQRAESAPAEPQSETWRRIPLAPGVELHLREPQPAAMQSRIQTLIAQAQALFRDRQE